VEIRNAYKILIGKVLESSHFEDQVDGTLQNHNESQELVSTIMGQDSFQSGGSQKIFCLHLILFLHTAQEYSGEQNFCQYLL
jgi:hypothetical protein